MSVEKSYSQTAETSEKQWVVKLGWTVSFETQTSQLRFLQEEKSEKDDVTEMLRKKI